MTIIYTYILLIIDSNKNIKNKIPVGDRVGSTLFNDEGDCGMCCPSIPPYGCIRTGSTLL